MSSGEMAKSADLLFTKSDRNRPPDSPTVARVESRAESTTGGLRQIESTLQCRKRQRD